MDSTSKTFSVFPKTPFLTVFIWTLLLDICNCYKPVFIIHGILSQNTSMVNFSKIINEFHPETKVYVSSRYCGWHSLSPIIHQANELGSDLLQISALHPEGFHLIGYSQGGLLSRTLLELFPYHTVHTFISLSSPQAGQYGVQMFHDFFPHIVREEAYKIFYTSVGQHISVANYWNDPHHQKLYYKTNKFLPIINNEVPHNLSSHYKDGITKLKRMILIGGPDDGIIEPWQSSHFAYFNDKEEIVPLYEQEIFQNDTFGLRSLHEKGHLKINVVNGVGHHFWYRNLTVIKQYILPWLT